MTSTMAEKRVKLQSSDGVVFEVDEAVAFESQAIKNMLEDTDMDSPLPLDNVSSKILAKVIEYCKYHVEMQTSDDEPRRLAESIGNWDADFVKFDQATLFDLIVDSAKYGYCKNRAQEDMHDHSSWHTIYPFISGPALHSYKDALKIAAANYLNIKNLLDLTCRTLADLIKGKTPEECRKLFNIEKDFTDLEEEGIRREHEWAFE